MSNLTGTGYFLALASGALSGAWLLGSANSLRMSAPTISHSVGGALAGAIIGVELYKRWFGLRGSTGTAFVGPFAVGIATGRLGCLFSGLSDRTYGLASSLPWAVDLGDGIGRHPVQIYEALAMLLFLLAYVAALAARQRWTYRRSFYVLVGWYGLQRFIWEFLKPYPRLVGPLNVFHLLCLGLVVYGVVYFAADIRHERAAARRGAVPLLRPNDEPVRNLP